MGKIRKKYDADFKKNAVKLSYASLPQMYVIVMIISAC